MAASQIALRHFGRATVKALARKGIRVTGLQGLPGPDGTFFNSETGYLMDDNGCGRVWTFADVQAAAK